MNLECENCGYEAGGKDCSACGEKVPAWSLFCPLCGQAFKKEEPAPSGQDPFSVENRRLCPDGNCIGILGEDGNCIVCGKS